MTVPTGEVDFFARAGFTECLIYCSITNRRGTAYDLDHVSLYCLGAFYQLRELMVALIRPSRQTVWIAECRLTLPMGAAGAGTGDDV